jgi:hypothetical protein
VTVTFVEPGFTDEVDNVTVGAGSEIAQGDGSNIGDNILLGGEFIDIGDSSLVYRVRGDGPAHPTPGYSTTGFDPLAYYLFEFDFGASGDQIVSVAIVLQDVIGVALSSEVFFTDDSLQLYVGTLGVLGDVLGGPDLGTITLNLEIESNGPPVGAVPEPSSVAALGLGLVALAWRRYRRS